MHEAPKSVSMGGHRRTGANRHTPSDLGFRHFPPTAADRSTSWHQWHAAYPTLRRTGTLRRLASENASSPHSHQSTGLLACWRRYGEVADAKTVHETIIPARPRCPHEGRAGCGVIHASGPRFQPAPVRSLRTRQHVQKLVVDEQQFSADLDVAEEPCLDQRVQPSRRGLTRNVASRRRRR